ncbi:IclR family transcriptional regulator [Mycolicibacterium komossense]|uniref:IclR family transcriptional regulator n=1 Tax=Mycolicibacterium komossense TaxID=1779 RepID=A0ABT3CHS9_9MYCO|nr:IclR family transcriptional regulator [Mycolicibacterium komossense]MCV7229048.1 IclR family transcriptional regulator [Mycolicibacterium komossense]
MKTAAVSEKSASLIGVERTARILTAVAESEVGNLTEIARRTELNEATVLRYLNSLSALGYVERFNANQYRLGWEIFRLGQRAFSNQVPSEAVLPTMTRLMNEFNETVNFAVHKDHSVVILEVVEGKRAVTKVSDVGQTDPWHASALGKAMLATMPDSVWRDIVASAGLPELTTHTITSMKKMAVEIKEIRELGFAVDREEAAEELTCVAAAVPSSNGGPSRYALSISFLTHRLDPENLERAGAQVIAGAREIAAKLP